MDLPVGSAVGEACRRVAVEFGEPLHHVRLVDLATDALLRDGDALGNDALLLLIPDPVVEQAAETEDLDLSTCASEHDLTSGPDSWLASDPFALRGTVKPKETSELPDCFAILGGKIPDMGQSQRMQITPLDAHDRTKTNEEICGILPTEWFNESHTPPHVPSDPFYKLEITTMYVPSSKPYEIGNALLEFLATQVNSNILKTRRSKFTIKAEVFVGHIMCMMKIRVYDDGESMYAVEFQRRSGDVMAFNCAYQQATKFILPQFMEMGTTGIPEAGAMFLPLPRLVLGASAEDDEAADLQGGFLPLLDMAGQVEHPELQAESASSLADIAQDDEQGKLLCTTEAFQEFKKLLRNDQTDVAYPTACMLQSLAKYPEAAQCFADDNILSMILEKVQSKKGCALVKQKLAQALNAATSRCAASLSEMVSEEVMEALKGAIHETGGGNAPMRKDLQDAQKALWSRKNGMAAWALEPQADDMFFTSF